MVPVHPGKILKEITAKPTFVNLEDNKESSGGNSEEKPGEL